MTTKVATGSRDPVDGGCQAEVSDDVAGFEREVCGNKVRNGVVVDVARTEGVHSNAHGVGHTDGVGDLDFTLLGKSRSDHVLGSPAGGIGSRPVHLGRVLARKGTTAVAATAAVGVDDDLASGQTGVSVRTTGVGKAARGVDVDGGLALDHQRGRDDGANDVLDHLLANKRLLGFFGAVLGDHVHVLNGDHDVVGVDRLTVITVHQGDLRFGVGTGPRKRPVEAEFADPPSQRLGKGDGERHPAAFVFGVGLGLVASIAEHEALVARTLFVNGLHHAAVDVGRLAGDELGDFANVLGGGVHANAV